MSSRQGSARGPQQGGQQGRGQGRGDGGRSQGSAGGQRGNGQRGGPRGAGQGQGGRSQEQQGGGNQQQQRYGGPPSSTGSQQRPTTGQQRPTSSSQQLESQFQRVKIGTNAPISVDDAVKGAMTHVARPNFGRLGRRITVIANLYKVSIPDRDISRYDVVVKPDKVPKPVCRRVMEHWKNMDHSATLGWSTKDKENVKNIAYDGQKLLYSPFPLKNIGTSFSNFNIEMADDVGGNKRTFTLSIREIKPVNMSVLLEYLDPSPKAVEIPSEAISALEVILRQSPSLRFTTNPAGRCFYSDKGVSTLPGGIDVHYGWYQSLRATLGIQQEQYSYKELLLNIDVVATAFYQQGPLLNVIANFFGKRRIEDCQRSFTSKNDLRKLDKFITGLNVIINYRNTGRRKYKIKGLAAQSVQDTKIRIKDDDGVNERTTTVQQFFRNTYNYNVKYPWMPAIVSGANNVQIPMECCDVLPNQRYVKKINEEQAADMIKVTAVLPEKRKLRITEGLSNLHGSNDKALLNNWKVEINNNLKQVEARVLDTPSMTFGKSKPQKIFNNGSWKQSGFAKPGILVSWSVALFGGCFGRPGGRDFGILEEFMNKLGGGLTSQGVEVLWPDTTEEMTVLEVRGDIRQTLINAKNKAAEVGNRFKNAKRSNGRTIDLVLCVLPPGKNAHIYNEIKKVAETDLGIMTQCLQQKKVAEQKGGYFQNLILKINAKLGGVNAYVVPSDIPLNTGNRVPTRANNGVSIAALVGSVDSGFAEYRSSVRVQAGRQEIVNDLHDMVIEIFEMFRERSKGVYPQKLIVYRDGVGEGQFSEVIYNELKSLKKAFQTMKIKPPTVTFLSVNKRHHVRFFPANPKDGDKNGIVHPYEFDFFLNSHPGLQGTSRPTHYHVFTKAVSIVPAVYYAHLLAYRARCHIEKDDGSDNLSQVSQDLDVSRITKEISNSMFFV
ncbi:Eukaryotic translation initiation factor 2C [Clydaea vesicula]|uniref:Eukaryotic translation initiation factor 2C n=1 Tax=Clydaea vesicula TaxID=447962 RepID=A0AAD5XXG8_9FUNG|nr:Eukaryotic translation initiation factor 2C [Clydaea vesicula]